MLNVLYLTLITLTRSSQQVAQKEYAKRTVNSSFLYSFIAITSAIPVFLIISGFNLTFRWDLAVYSIIFAITFCVSMVTGFLAIKTGPLSLSALINQYSLMVPALYGIIVFKEPTKVTLFIGIALLVVSLLLVNLKKEKDVGSKISLKWVIFVTIAFVSNGICSTVLNVQQVDFNKLYKSEFLIIGYVIASLILLTLTLIFERKTFASNFKKGWLAGVCGGVSNGASNFLVMVLATLMPVSVYYPVVSASATLLTALIAFFFYKEKMSVQKVVGIAIGVAAIVMLNL